MAGPKRGLVNELAVRASLALVLVVFHETFGSGAASPLVLVAALIGFLVNVPYYLLGRTGRWPVVQAYARMGVDILLITLGLYSAGGLGAAAYASIYAIVPVYAGIALSSTACLSATVFSTVCYLAVSFAQQGGWLSPPPAAPGNPWAILTFNLVVLNVIGASTAALSRALRRSRRYLNTLNRELALRSQRLQTLVEVTRGLTRGLDLPVVLGGIATSSARLFEGDAGLRLLEGEELVRVAATAGAATAMARDRIRLGESLSGRVAATGTPIVAADTVRDDRLLPEHRAAVRADRTGALLCVPVRVGDRIAGTLHVYRERGYEFDGDALGIAMNLADQAGIAIENARLYHAAQRALQDLSDTQAQLAQAQKMDAIGRLAGGVAHDFNNLLMVIMGRSAVMRHRLPADHAIVPEIEYVEDAAARAAELTRQLLAFSRRQVFELKVIDLNAVVSRFAPILRRLIGEDVELVHALDPTLGALRADASQVQQVVMNLAVNARDAMPRGGKLMIETMNVDLDEGYARQHHDVRPGRYVMLAVTDSGTGMDAGTLAHIFEPFFTSKGPGQGTGLGLATVYGIVKQSGGHIWVYSEPGFGTTFKIYFPRVDEAPEAERPAPAAVIVGGSETILVAEDDAAVRELVREVLASRGYAVLTAPHGAAALEIAAAHPGPIHLLVTDMVMPGMNGQELAKQLVRVRPDTRVVYVSGYPDAAVSPPLAAGAVLVQKPIMPDAFLMKIRVALDS